MDNPIDDIGENEKLLRASKDFQKLGEGKKKAFIKRGNGKTRRRTLWSYRYLNYIPKVLLLSF